MQDDNVTWFCGNLAFLLRITATPTQIAAINDNPANANVRWTFLESWWKFFRVKNVCKKSANRNELDYSIPIKMHWVSGKYLRGVCGRGRWWTYIKYNINSRNLVLNELKVLNSIQYIYFFYIHYTNYYNYNHTSFLYIVLTFKFY
jgi:hypothetical protein